MPLTLAEVETKIAHLESAVIHLKTYGMHESAAVIEEMVAEGKLYAEKLKGEIEDAGGEHN